MAGGLSCSCQSDVLVPRIMRQDGTFIYPAIDPDTSEFTIELTDLEAETPFVATAGPGIHITPGGLNGHAPLIKVVVDPASPIPLEFVSIAGDDCLRARLPAGSDPHWGPAGTISAGGITVIPGGVNGHSPTFQIAIAPNQPLGFDSQGRLLFSGSFTPSMLAAAKLEDIGNVQNRNGRPYVNGNILMFDQAVDRWYNWPLQDALAAVWGHYGTTIPAPPLTGPAVFFKFDPATGTFGWNP